MIVRMHRAVLVATVAAALGAAAACDDGSADGPDAATDPIDAAVDAPVDAPRPPPGEARGSYQLTYYWVTAEADYPGTPTERVYGKTGCAVLATVTPEYARSLRLEGTGRLLDGRVINVSGACACPASPCFVEVDEDHPWGYGVQDRPLVPYRSVAVDREVVPYGTTLWLAELDGVPVPGEPPWGGFVHDGCVQAVDTGGGIDGMQLDWFVGLRASYRTLDAALDLSRATVHDGGARCP
jgi:3D (Asp-Asp-Asp) domain-containing protein